VRAAVNIFIDKFSFCRQPHSLAINPGLVLASGRT
jgi:hypothetical protein